MASRASYAFLQTCSCLDQLVKRLWSVAAGDDQIFAPPCVDSRQHPAGRYSWARGLTP